MSTLSHSPAVAGCPLDAELWRKLREMQLDAPGASLTFTKRLARDNGWSLARAREVVEEYRRFLYLAARAGHPVTPSDAVDQVWHLHLVYTRHYWGVLCRDILGFDLHHGPTLGGTGEQSKFGTWYARTLASYRAAFGEPSADIWPSVEQRFVAVEHMRRVDVGAYWMLPRPAPGPKTLIGLAALVSLIPAAAALLHGGLAGAFLPAGMYAAPHSPDPAVAIAFVGLMVAAGLFVFVVFQTRSLIGSVIIAALQLIAAAMLPRGDAIWTMGGVAGCLLATVLSLIAFALFARLYRTRDQRPPGKGKGSGCGGGCGGTSHGNGDGGGGCGGCGG